jgi:hypothetical protein
MLMSMNLLITLTVIAAIFIFGLSESLLSSVASVDLFQFITQLLIVQGELSRIIIWLLVIREECFLVVEVREVVVTIGSQRLWVHFVGASRVRRHYIIPLSFIIIFIKISSIAPLSLVFNITRTHILWLLH